MPHGILREIDRIVFKFSALALTLRLYLFVKLLPRLILQVVHDTLAENILCLFLCLLCPALIELRLRLTEEGFNTLLAKEFFNRAESLIELCLRDLILRCNHACHDRLHLNRRHCARILREIVDFTQERLETAEHTPHGRRRGFPFRKIHLKSTGKPLLPPTLQCRLFRNSVARLLRRENRVLVIAELIGKVRILVFLRRALVPLCPRIDRLKLFRRCFVHLCELVQIHQEHVTHLVHERRFIRTLKKCDDALPVLFGDFSPHLLTEHLVERFGFAFTYQFEDPDNFCVSDNALIGILPIIARRSSHKIGIVIGVSSRLIQAFYCCFLEFVEAVIAPRLCDIYSACAVKFFVCPVPIYPVMRVFDIITNLVLFIRKSNPNMRGLQCPLFVDIHKLNVDNFPLPIIKWNCMCALANIFFK